MRHVLYAMCGLCSLWVLSRIDYHRLGSFTVPLMIGFVVLHIFVYATGPVGFIQWEVPYLTQLVQGGQVTELTVLMISVQFLACIDLGGPLKNHCTVSYWAFVIFVILSLLVSRNLGVSMVPLITLCILYLLVNKWVVLAYLAMAFMLFFVLSEASRFSPIIQHSIQTWLNPFSDPQGGGFAAVQSIYAIADGGAFGVGVGNGTMRYAVKDVYSTFMFPAITQEIGVIGAVMILLIYLLFLMRVFIIAARARDRFGFYLSAAIMVRYCVVLSLILFSSVNLIPQIGNLSPPFLSYGGDSLMIDFFLVGIMLSIGRYQVESARR